MKWKDLREDEDTIMDPTRAYLSVDDDESVELFLPRAADDDVVPEGVAFTAMLAGFVANAENRDAVRAYWEEACSKGNSDEQADVE